MLPEDKLLEILSNGTPQQKCQVLDRLLQSQTSSREIVEALEQATHDEDMGVVVRAIKALQADVHHRKALETGLFGTTWVEPEADLQAPAMQIPPPEQDQSRSTQLSGRGVVETPPQGADRSASGATPSSSITTPLELAKPTLLPPPAGVIRRGAALLIDLLILAAIITGAGLLFGNLLEQLGLYARLLSALLTLIYFSVFNSSLLSGATPGKRFKHLQVVDAQGNTIHLPLALLRSLILVFIVLTYGWQIPGIITTRPILTAIYLILVGLCAAIVLLALLNRQSGQSLDDLLASTHVVYQKGVPVEVYPVTPRRYLIGCIVTMIILPLGLWGVSRLAQARSTNIASTQQLLPLYQALNRDPQLYMAGLSEGYQQTPSQQLIKLLVISLWPRGTLDDGGRQKVAQEAAALAQEKNALSGYGGLQVQVIGGYDLGFFERSIVWLCAPPAGCSAKIVNNTFLRVLNFTSNYQIAQ
jgi:uncharacterized RDD family membrane protein YckC